MPTRKRNVEIDVKVDDSQAKSKLKGVGDTAQDASKKFGGLGSSAGILKTGLAAVAATQVVDFLKDSATNALADIAAQNQLALAVENATTATELEVDAVADYIDKTQAATGITDDELRPAFANLVRATGDVTEAQELMTTAMDIATATGKPLEAVTMGIAKAVNGNVGALGKMGLKVRDASGDYLELDDIIAQANETMGGATQVAAESVEGKMKRLAIAVDEAKEGFGEIILLPVAEWFAGIFDNLQKVGDQNFLDAVLEDIAALGEGTEAMKENNPILYELIESFKWWGDTLGNNTRPALDLTTQATKNSRAAMEEIIPELSGAASATQDVADATYDATAALKDHVTEVRAQMDPAFALAEANRDIAEAQADATTAAEKFGEGSPEHIAALDKVREGVYDARDAEIAMAEQGGVTADEMRGHLRSLGQYTEDEIDLIIADMERLNAFRFDPKTIRITHKVTGGGPQEYDQGGVVPGPVGAPQLAVVHGGETVLPTHKTGSRTRGGSAGAGMVNHITINAGMGTDPNAISRALVEALQRYQRANGAIPIRTTG